MWALEGKGFLGKIKVGRRTCFGLPEGVEKAESGLEGVRELEQSYSKLDKSTTRRTQHQEE